MGLFDVTDSKKMDLSKVQIFEKEIKDQIRTLSRMLVKQFPTLYPVVLHVLKIFQSVLPVSK